MPDVLERMCNFIRLIKNSMVVGICFFFYQFALFLLKRFEVIVCTGNVKVKTIEHILNSRERYWKVTLNLIEK